MSKVGGIVDQPSIIPPIDGWEANTTYIVIVSLSNTDKVHSAIFYSGNLEYGIPAKNNELFNPNYEYVTKFHDVHFLEVIEQIYIQF